MRYYLVGGAIRDTLLQLPVKDRDYVVVGETVASMLQRGFYPVGRDFPVFLHPKTHEEYALARTERKTGHGYTGFQFYAAPDVTLEQDLERRDLTINAMAQAVNDNHEAYGAIIDPYGGQKDLQSQILRHISPAFSEDPLRILRVARFNARFPDFRVAAETKALLMTMVQAGELQYLSQERVWQELARGLLEKNPEKMIITLHQCHALAALLPELFAFTQESLPEGFFQWQELRDTDLALRFSLFILSFLRHHSEQAPHRFQTLCRRLPLPKACQQLTAIVLQNYQTLLHLHRLKADELIEFFDACDAWRRPERFEKILTIHALLIANRCAEILKIRQALQAARQASISDMTSKTYQEIKAAMRAARIAALQKILRN